MEKRTISLRWSLLTALVCFLAIKICVGAITLWAGTEIADSSAAEGTRATAAALARSVEIRYDHARQLIVAGARRPGLIRFLREGDTQRIHYVTDVIFNDTPFYKSVFVTDAELEFKAGLPKMPVDVPYATELEEAVGSNTTFVSDAFFDGESVVVLVAHPVIGHREQVIGLLAGLIDIEAVTVDLRAMQYGESGFNQLIDADGMIMSSDHQSLGSPAAFVEQLSVATTSGADEFAHLAEDGTSLHSTSVSMDNVPWRVVVSQPHKDREAKSTYLRTVVVLTMVIGVMSAVGLGVWFIQRITTPIQEISSAAIAVSQMDIERRAPLGTIKEFRDVAKAVNDMADHLTGLVSQIEDDNIQLEKRVSERTELLEQEMDDRIAAERRLRKSQRVESLGRMTATVGHEINNPLTTILISADQLHMWIEQLRHEHPEIYASLGQSELTQFTEDILDGAEAIKTIVQRIQNYVRGDDETPKAIDVKHALETSIGMVRKQVDSRGQLHLEVSNDMPHVVGTESALQQVFINLLTNAARALRPEQYDENIVSIRTLVHPDRVTVDVIDNGCGIPEDVLPKIFEPFFSQSESGGMGLGLSVTAEILKRFGGAIDVDSDPSRGTRVRVTLQSASPELLSDDTTRNVIVPNEAVDTSLRILLVDDQTSVLRAMEILLSAYDVTAVSSAEEAIALHRSRPFDLIVCDLMMPGVDGIDLYHAISETSSDDSSRIVFATGGAFTDRATEFLASHENQCLQKPVSKDQLLRVVEQYASRSST